MPTRVQLPDGSIGEFPDGMPESQIEAVLQKQYGSPKTVPTTAKPKGFVDSLEDASGLSSLSAATHHPLDAIASLPGSLIDEAGRVGSQLKQAWNTPNNQPLKAIDRTMYSIPFVGASLKNADDQFAKGNYGGAAGSTLGAIAPVAAGAIGGGLLKDMIPSTARAGKVFQSLDTDLANHPVPLNSTLQPLQRATELGARGGTLPKAASDLLTRSQGLEPMNYPEIRDYQSNLSDLSRDAEGSMNRKMLGQIGRVGNGLYDDIHKAASSVGRGEDYANAMKEYRQAVQLKDTAKKIGAVGGGALVGATAGPKIWSSLKGIF